MKFIIPIVLLFVSAFSCNKNTYHANQHSIRNVHKIAILPVEVVMTGKQPSRLKPEDITKIEEVESQLLQGRIQESVVMTTMGKKKRSVTVMDMAKVNNLIYSGGSSIRQSWSADSEQLAKLLGVDAVIKTRVTKTRYMSNLASYGSSLSADVLDLIKRFYLPGSSEGNVEGPGLMKKTNTIEVNIRLIQAKDGSVLWSFTDVSESDWNTSMDKALESSFQKMEVSFPRFK